MPVASPANTASSVHGIVGGPLRDRQLVPSEVAGLVGMPPDLKHHLTLTDFVVFSVV